MVIVLFCFFKKRVKIWLDSLCFVGEEIIVGLFWYIVGWESGLWKSFIGFFCLRDYVVINFEWSECSFGYLR